MTTQPDRSLATRRQALTAGGLGLAAAAVLAACGKDDAPRPGISGGAVPTTVDAPTVPEKKPTAAQLEADVIQLATAASVERLAADTYTKWTKRFASADLQASAERFAAAHDAAAQAYLAEVPDITDAAKANEYLEKNLVTPAEESMIDDESIASFFGGFESLLAANAINAVGIYTGIEWRQRSMTFGAAAARRAAYLTDASGADATPQDALYPLLELMPGDAFLNPKGENAADGS